MSLIINGTTIPITGDFVKFGTSNVDKVVCDGVTVWEKQKDIDGFTIPGTINHGPDYVEQRCTSDNPCDWAPTRQYINYHTPGDNVSGKFRSWITKSGNTYEMIAQSSASEHHSGNKGTQYVAFSVDLTAIKKIEVVGTWVGTGSTGSSVSSQIYLTTHGSSNLTSTKQSVYFTEQYDGDSVSRAISVTLNTGSCSGTHTVRLNNDYHCSGATNVMETLKITKIMFYA